MPVELPRFHSLTPMSGEMAIRSLFPIAFAMPPSIRACLPSLLVGFLVPAGIFGTVHLAAFISSLTGVLGSPLWLPSAVLVTALLRSPVRLWPALNLLAVAAYFAACLSFFGPVSALAYSIFNTAEGLLIAAAMHRFAANRLWYTSLSWIGRFILFTLAACALVAFLVAQWGYSFAGMPYDLAFWFDLFLSDSLGVFIGTPFLLSWTEPALRRSLTRRMIAESLILTVVVALLSWWAFASSLPVVIVIFPILAFTALRGGLVGATTGTFAFATIAVWFLVNRGGFLASLDISMYARSVLLQSYLLAALLSTIPVAIVMAIREALTAEVRRQDSISSAALNNMAQGLCMFDGRGRLVTSNRRFTELYSFSKDSVEPGLCLREVLELRIGARTHWGDPDEFLSDCLRDIEELNPHREVELHDGRIIDIRRTPLATGGWVETHEDVTERRRAGHRIAHLATHDSLTDLPNRAFFNDQLQRAIALAERGHSFALHCLDLDRFKAVNDTLGHAAGDELLKQVAGRLTGLLRNSDLVARLGGDEFAILQFPLESTDEAAALAARVVESLAEPYNLMGNEAVIGTSIGIALSPYDSIDQAELQQKGDLALYRAKTDGRNNFRLFEAGMDSVLHKRRALESELRAAVQKGEFELYFQPIMNIESGAIASMEALLRWRHPVRGLILPEQFISVAEETGLILPIGEWVLRHACREAAKWPENVNVAVNLSPVQFTSRSLAALVINAVKAANLSPKRLELEITETLLLQQSDAVLATLSELHEAGICIVMDDFGTGYSSLSYLRSFPFDKVKIDQSFVRDLDTVDCLAIVHATTELTAKLGMRSTAEGVETAEQLAVLRSEGCTEVQGYYISHPIPAEDVAHLFVRFPRTKLKVVQQRAS